MSYEPCNCCGEEEARDHADELIANKHWPCYFFSSDVIGDKDSEGFFTDNEDRNMGLFDGVGVIKMFA